MTSGMRTIIYPVKDLDSAKALHGKLLGVTSHTDEAYYVGFNVAGQEVGLDPRGHRDGVTPYWHVDDIEASLQPLLDAGAELLQAIKNVGGGRLIASVKDADGNIIGLLQSD